MQNELLPYAVRMAVELGQLRALVAVVDTGTFTDAAIELRVSQAAVSRSLKALERELGVVLIRRGPRHSVPTPVGKAITDQARRVLSETDRMTGLAATGRTTLRLGYAWAAIGTHTVALQRRWASAHPGTHLVLVRANTPTSGLAEGHCDAAVVRVPVDPDRFSSTVVGTERRLAAFATGDPWTTRRSLRMSEIAGRTVLIDTRTGTTQLDLWPEGQGPRSTVHTGDVDEWLDAIAAGEGVGTTSEATRAHYPRPGVTYRLIADGPRIPVSIAWRTDDPPPSVHSLVDLTTKLYRSDPSEVPSLHPGPPH